jgi:hypothetical protein
MTDIACTEFISEFERATGSAGLHATLLRSDSLAESDPVAIEGDDRPQHPLATSARRTFNVSATAGAS